MAKSKIYSKHLLTSLGVLITLIVAIFLSKDFIQEIIKLLISQDTKDLLIATIYPNTITYFLITLSVLISYIIYIQLSYNTYRKIDNFSIATGSNLSREQFWSIYDNSPVPYFILDSDAKIQGQNKSALRFFGVFPEEITGKNFFSYLSGAENEQFEMFFQYYKSHIAINKKEVQMTTKNGDARIVELSIYEMPNPGTFTNTGLAMIFDITEQKLLDKAKTEFVSLASHQLKSPLAEMKWLTEMLSSGSLGEFSPKQIEYINKLNTANEDMIALVDLLLNVSRTEMGRITLDIKETNVETLSESVLNELAPLITKKGIIIEKEYNNLLQVLKTDPKLLRIVIQNLVSNAIKYTPDGGTVSISFSENSGKSKIIVSDTGLGIPKDQQCHIFTKLFRADNVRSSSTSQGTGLGLYLVKSMVQAINGDIDFVSEENKGSTFSITLNN